MVVNAGTRRNIGKPARPRAGSAGDRIGPDGPGRGRRLWRVGEVDSELAQGSGIRWRVSELRTAMYAAAVGKLADLSGKAADTLGELLGSETEQVQLQASKAVLELGPRLREHVDLSAEVDALRKELEGDGDSATEGTGATSGSRCGAGVRKLGKRWRRSGRIGPRR